MQKIEAVFFDLDGTLLDSALDFHFVLNQMLHEKNKESISIKEVKQQVSNGARAMVSYAFSLKESDTMFNTLKEDFLARYFAEINRKSQLYPNINKLLGFLEENAIPWGVITNKPQLYTDIIMLHFRLNNRAATIICPDHVSNSKPDPEALLLACKQVSVKPLNCWYVGDHLRDIQAAKSAGMTSVGCQYGYLNQNEKASDWQADFVVHSPLELIELVKKNL